MFRKSIIAIATVSALAAAALTPTSAFAWHPHHHFHGHYWHGRGFGWFGPALVAGAIVTGAAVAANACYVRRWVATPYGPRRVWVNVC